jgi:hypothetical protein|tara:strand:+ start:523 stop:855 length:333 start_codon:yes stop_codon:yes gene_type:complete
VFARAGDLGDVVVNVGDAALIGLRSELLIDHGFLCNQLTVHLRVQVGLLLAVKTVAALDSPSARGGDDAPGGGKCDVKLDLSADADCTGEAGLRGEGVASVGVRGCGWSY